MIFYFLARREVIYRQVRFEFQMMVENRDGKDSLSKFVPLKVIRLCPAVHMQPACWWQKQQQPFCMSLGRLLNSCSCSKL